MLARIGTLCCGDDAGEGSAHKSATKDRGKWTIEDKQERDFVEEKRITTQIVKELGLKDNGRKVLRAKSSIKPTARSRLRTETQDEQSLINFPVDFAQAESLRAYFEGNSGGSAAAMSASLVIALLEDFKHLMQDTYDSAVATVSPPNPGKLVVVGDTHGQLHDVLVMFAKLGPPSKDNVYLFNGDICDRGENACEIWLLLIVYALAEPSCIMINRGNHECEHMHCLTMQDGGGFRDEIFEKYNKQVYDEFIAMMKFIPLCTVIGEKVFVVHAGLSDEDFTLDDVRTIPHTTSTQPDPEVSGGKMDRLWQCLLWSDPQTARGITQSDRGVGVLFGPDVTTKFFRANDPIKLLIRSHQLPENDIGIQYNHFKRCITIFSASNYCGFGNKGAVLIFNGASFPEHEVFEYYSPPMNRITTLVGQSKTVDDWLIEGQREYDEDRSVVDAHTLQEELRMIMLGIVESKPQLYEQFMKDTEGKQYEVSFKMWKDILSAVCGNDWNWEKAWASWGLGDSEEATVNFVDFLKRFTAVFENLTYSGFKFKAIVTIFDQLLACQGKLEDEIKRFDQDGDGRVSADELRRVVAGLGLDISKAQVDALVSMVYRGAVSLSITKFVKRLAQLANYAHEATDGGGATPENRTLRELTMRVGELIQATDYNDLMGDRPLDGAKGVSRMTLGCAPAATTAVPDAMASKLVALFKLSDEDGNGLLSVDEFTRSIMMLPGILDIQLSSGETVNEEKIRQLAKMNDANGDGNLNIYEFENLLFVDETVGDELAENMISVILRHRTSIRATCCHYDLEGAGSVTQDQFLGILRSLNKIVRRTGHHWSDSQMVDLCEAFALEGAKVCYNSLFQNLRIVDGQDPTNTARVEMAWQTSTQ